MSLGHFFIDKYVLNDQAVPVSDAAFFTFGTIRNVSTVARD
jgi:hypothetical protein